MVVLKVISACLFIGIGHTSGSFFLSHTKEINQHNYHVVTYNNAPHSFLYGKLFDQRRKRPDFADVALGDIYD